ncbi:MAG: hypothetical protein IJP70_11795 [Bacteroidales bacterium]|nr:hypothetical protein [Bacteroidales bacterium]
MMPAGLETTANMMLDFMSNSNEEQQKDMAAFIKMSMKKDEIKALFDFSMSLLHTDVIPIRESIYDTGIDGVKELNEYMIDKYGRDSKSTNAANTFCWLILRLPAKEEMKRLRLVY